TLGRGNRLGARNAELIRDDLAKVGIKVNLEQIDFEKLKWNLNFNSGFECAILLRSQSGIEPYLDSLRSSDSMHLFTSIPPTDWEKRIDSLLIKQLGTMDPAIQKNQWDEIQMIMAEQLPLIATVTRHTFGSARFDVANLRPSNVTVRHLTWNLEALYFRQ